jgi:hypothetical protein
MPKTKHLWKKSIYLMDFSKRRTVAAIRAYARKRTFQSIIQLGRDACQCTAFPGIRLVAKTVKGVFVSVVKKKHVWPAPNPVSIRIAISNKATPLCYFDLKRHQMLH